MPDRLYDKPALRPPIGRRAVLAGLLGLPALATRAAQGDPAEPYPARPVRYIVPFGADGESSIAARLQRPLFEQLTTQDLIIDYRPGGGGATVWEALNRLPADGHTIVGINLPHIALQPAAGARYRTRDIAASYIFHYTPHAIAVRDGGAIGTLEDLVRAAKAAPGAVAFTGAGPATANHLAHLRFNQLADIRANYLPFKGSAASIAALLGGEGRAAWTYPTTGLRHARAIRLLAVAMAERHPRFPEVPTFGEFGYPLVDGTYRGIAVPHATPEPIRARLSDIFAAINSDPSHRSTNEALALSLVDIDHSRAADFIAEHTAEYLSLAHRAGLIN